MRAREVHEMFLCGPTEQGVSEWVCYVCGRRLLERYGLRIVLSAGSEEVNHSFVTGNKRIIAVGVTSDSYRTDDDDTWLTANGIEWGND